MRFGLLIAAATTLIASTEAFSVPATSSVARAVRGARAGHVPTSCLMAKEDPEDSIDSSDVNIPAVTGATAAFWALTSSAAFAAGPDWGIFEGKTGSLLHPVMMGSLLFFSVSTAILGFEWRRQRTIGDEISALKKNIPNLGGASSVADAISAAQSAETPNAASITQLQAAMPIETQVKELQAERKELAAKGPRDQHYSQGAMLAFLGTCFAIEGPLNTYARAGKLFPGPHLYAGAGLICLWALALACVPAMQKGNDVARTVHVAANAVGIGMFGWQVVSGVPILLKVWEKTQWP